MDHREAVRVPVRVKARCRSEGIVIHGLVEDLSRSGMFLVSPERVVAGAAAELTLEVPGEGAPLRLDARVVRVEHGERREGMAFRFVDPGAVRRTLADLILREHQAAQ